MTRTESGSVGEEEPRWLTLFAAVTAVLALVCIWVPAVWPGRDVPMHALAARVVSAPELFSPLLVPNFPLSGQAHGAIAGALCWLLPLSVHTASKVVATLGALALASGLVTVARAVRGSTALAIAAGAAMSVGWTFGMGFSSFALGVGLGWLALGLALQRLEAREHARASTTAQNVLLGVVALLAVWCHFVGAGLSYAAFALVWAQRRPRDPKMLAPWIPGALWAAFAAYSSLVARVATGEVTQTGTRFGDMTGLWQDVTGTAFVSFGGVVATVSGGALALIALAVTAAAATRVTDGAGRALARVLFGWWLLFLCTPLHALGWHFARPRQIAMVVVLPLVLIPLLRLPPGLRSAIAGMAAVALLCATGANVRGTVRAAQDVQAALASVDVTEAAGPTYLGSALALEQAGWGPHVQHTVGVAAYALLDGGVARHLFATNPAVHAMLYGDDVVEQLPATSPTFVYQQPGCESRPSCLADAPARGDALAQMLLPWQTLAFVGVDEPLASRLITRGFDRVAPAVFRPRAASVTLILERPSTVGDGPLVVRWGYDTLGVVGTAVARAREDGLLEVTASPLLGGPVVLEVFFDNDRNNEPGEADTLALSELRQRLTLEPGEHKRLELRRAP